MSDDSGTCVDTERREHPDRHAAVLLLINTSSEILMVRTRRLPDHWQALGGGIEPDDLSAKHAAIREVREEAGIEIGAEDIEHLCDAPHDFGAGTIHFFLGRLRVGTKLLIDAVEIAEARWFALAGAAALPMFPAMANALSRLAARPGLSQE